MNEGTIITYLACIILLFIFGKIFVLPLTKIFKLVLNSFLGAFLIYIINLIGSHFEFHIGLNIITSIFVGILGIPGAILLILLKIFLSS